MMTGNVSPYLQITWIAILINDYWNKVWKENVQIGVYCSFFLSVCLPLLFSLNNNRKSTLLTFKELQDGGQGFCIIKASWDVKLVLDARKIPELLSYGGISQSQLLKVSLRFLATVTMVTLRWQSNSSKTRKTKHMQTFKFRVQCHFSFL